jgi:hypothetical protein
MTAAGECRSLFQDTPPRAPAGAAGCRREQPRTGSTDRIDGIDAVRISRDLFEYSLLSMSGLYGPRLEWRPVPFAGSLREWRDPTVADLVTERR